MGKQGPCYHCGVTSTPLWRNGPPEKPVLCNACGSRWRTKGTLANYTPLHLRQESDYNLDNRVFKMKNILMNKKKDAKVLKRKHNHENGIAGDDVFYYNQGYRKNLDEDLSNRSSSGSAISYTESCAQLGNADASDLTGPVQSGGWETTVPLKKRTCVNQLQYSPVEKLTKDLYSILQEQQSSTLSESSEEDLLFESETPMVSVEIGHGSILIRHPSSIAREEESEASSLSVDNKQCHLSETNSHSAALPEHNDDMRVMLSSSKSDTIKDREGRRDNLQDENLEVLGHESSLCYIDLSDIVNFEEFVKILTSDEQQQLATYLPAVDTKTPESLRTLFDSPRFKEDLSSFHQLLAEGVLDISLSGVEMEDCNTLKRLALYNLNKSSWIEHYCLLKKCKNSTQGSHVVGASDVTAENKLVDFKSSLDIHNQNFSEAKAGPMNCKKWTMKSAYNKNEVIDSDSACVSPRSLFALPLDDPALSHFLRKNSDQELLLEVPSNDSFPQAELLQPTMGVGQ